MSYGYDSSGKKALDAEFTEYGQSFGVDDVIGCYLVRTCNNIFFCREVLYFLVFKSILFFYISWKLIFICGMILEFRILNILSYHSSLQKKLY